MNLQHIAQQYRAAAHTPQHPSYAAFVTETLAQWNVLLEAGLRVNRTLADSYLSSDAMFQDVAAGRLSVYSGASNLLEGHPLAHTLDDGWSVNEVFRAVHDVLGHYCTRTPFETFEGEVQAYRNHAKQYTAAAQLALYGETIGQLAHYYAGYGFVEVQRAVIIPIERNL